MPYGSHDQKLQPGIQPKQNPRSNQTRVLGSGEGQLYSPESHGIYFQSITMFGEGLVDPQWHRKPLKIVVKKII